MTIDIENEFNGEIAIPYEEIAERVVEEALESENCPYECSVELLLTDDASIREMNGEFREIDRSTDVLSFPMIEYEAPACFDGFDDCPELFHPESGELLLGDIVISMEHVKAQAEEYGHSEEREFAFLIAHSMLHLMGYDHMEEDERRIMEEKQEAILIRAGYTRDQKNETDRQGEKA
ncbi:MAG: rRNA maturation RNase YbeY [Eubacteriales bacterium]|nr:rRNA maturation RNase YbeY [Eubacteriales bacterium]